MGGSNRRQRCSRCGLQLMVPSDSESFRCSACQSITKVPPPSPIRGAINKLTTAATTRFSSGGPIKAGPAVPPIGGGGSHGHQRPAAVAGGVYYGGGSYGPPDHQQDRGRKKALLCGVSYKDKSYRIKGSINDVNCMRYFLIHKFGYPADSILTLTEEEGNPKRIPTKENIRRGLKWLVEGCKAGDSLVFYFSGHGTQQRDYDMDELDGFDETLCPLDFETEGMIIDDEINSTIVTPLPSGTILHAIIDSCHSGTVLDLPFVWEGQYAWEDHRRSEYCGNKKDTSGGLAICISACNDHQTSADTNVMAGNVSTGALTYSLIQAVQNEPAGISYGRLLNSMRLAIRAARSQGLRLSGPIASLVNIALFSSEMTQEPQLTCSQQFDVYARKFSL
ncbi:AMC1 [Linum perenne]